MKNENVVVIKQNCHAEFISASTPLITIPKKEEILKQVQDDNRNGFTLIELLVVVLIIGILAAVAVPQYQKAVAKSRYTAMKPIVKAIANAEEVYYLANGKYTIEIEDLDIGWNETPSSSGGNTENKEYVFTWGKCSINVPESDPRVVCSNEDIGMRYRIKLRHSPSEFAGMQGCSVDTLNTIQAQICQQESGLTEPQETGSPNSFYW